MSNVNWVRLSVKYDTGRSLIFPPVEMDVKASHILSMQSLEPDLNARLQGPPPYKTGTEVVLNEPVDCYSDDETSILRGLRSLIVNESIEEIRTQINSGTK
ncbi:hypothetical protein HKW90_29210 [Pseudomonas aeruginosa]|nr:hypothetical protein [Pseudomonas aeruginosa]